MKNGRGILKVSGRWLAAYFFRICDHLVPKNKSIVLVTLPGRRRPGGLVVSRAGKNSVGRRNTLAGPPGSRAFSGVAEQAGLEPHRTSTIRTCIRCAGYGRISERAPCSIRMARCSITRRRDASWSSTCGTACRSREIWRGVPGSELPLSTFLISTSAFFSDVLMKASGFGPERLLATGLPRNDFLTSDSTGVARHRGADCAAARSA